MNRTQQPEGTGEGRGQGHPKGALGTGCKLCPPPLPTPTCCSQSLQRFHRSQLPSNTKFPQPGSVTMAPAASVSGPTLAWPPRGPPHTCPARLAPTEIEGQPVSEPVLALDQPLRQLMVPALPVGRSHGSALQPQSTAHTRPSLTPLAAGPYLAYDQWVYGRNIWGARASPIYHKQLGLQRLDLPRQPHAEVWCPSGGRSWAWAPRDSRRRHVSRLPVARLSAVAAGAGVHMGVCPPLSPCTAPSPGPSGLGQLPGTRLQSGDQGLQFTSRTLLQLQSVTTDRPRCSAGLNRHCPRR